MCGERKQKLGRDGGADWLLPAAPAPFRTAPCCSSHLQRSEPAAKSSLGVPAAFVMTYRRSVAALPGMISSSVALANESAPPTKRSSGLTLPALKTSKSAAVGGAV